MTEAAVVFDDFSGGEYGDLGSRAAGKRGAMFTAKNMRVYKNGWIGPRAGLKSLGLTGLGAGTLWGLTYGPNASKELHLVIGTGVYLAPFSVGGAATSAGTLGGTPTKRIVVNESTRRLAGKLWFTVYGVGTYATTIAANTTAALAVIAGCRTLELFGDRLYAGGNDAAPELVAYSDAADFATWGALNFFEVGYEYPAFAMFAQRGSLTLLMQALMWRFSGTPASLSAVLRQASAALATAEGAAVMDGDVCIYKPSARTAPVTFDGGVTGERSLAHLEWTTRTYEVGGAVARGNDDVLFVSGGGDNRGLLRSNGIWTFHTFGQSIGANITRADADKFVVATTASTPVPHVLDMALDRPGFTSDTYARPGDGSDTPFDAYLHLPEWWDKQGREIRVRSVIIDFTKWATGSASTNHFAVTCRALNRYQSSGVNASASQSFDEAGSAATTAGVEDRLVLGFGDQGWGGGFDLQIDAIRGVAIRSITVLLDVDETRAS